MMIFMIITLFKEDLKRNETLSLIFRNLMISMVLARKLRVFAVSMQYGRNENSQSKTENLNIIPEESHISSENRKFRQMAQSQKLYIRSKMNLLL